MSNIKSPETLAEISTPLIIPASDFSIFISFGDIIPALNPTYRFLFKEYVSVLAKMGKNNIKVNKTKVFF